MRTSLAKSIHGFYQRYGYFVKEIPPILPKIFGIPNISLF